MARPPKTLSWIRPLVRIWSTSDLQLGTACPKTWNHSSDRDPVMSLIKPLLATKTASAALAMKGTRTITTERLREGALKDTMISMMTDLSQMNTDTHLDTIRSVMRVTTVNEIMTTIGHHGMTTTITPVVGVTLLATSRKSEPTMVVVEATTMMLDPTINPDPTMTMTKHTIKNRGTSRGPATVSSNHICSMVACHGLCTVRLMRRKRLVSTSSLVKDGEPRRLTMLPKATDKIHLTLTTTLIFLWSICGARNALTGPMMMKVSA